MDTGTNPIGIYKAMAEITKKIGAISKNKRCQHGASFSYRGIDDVYNALNPLLGEYDVFVLPLAAERTSEQRQTRNGANMEIVTVRMTYRFCHADGSSVECITIGEAMDSGDKATNKAMAVAHKYAILQAFCIPTEDMEDPDASAEPLAPRAAARQQRDQAKAENNDPMTKAQSTALMAYLTKRHGDNRTAYLKELSSFFGREIKSSRELTKADVSEFLDAVNSGMEAA